MDIPDLTSSTLLGLRVLDDKSVVETGRPLSDFVSCATASSSLRLEYVPATFKGVIQFDGLRILSERVKYCVSSTLGMFVNSSFSGLSRLCLSSEDERYLKLFCCFQGLYLTSTSFFMQVIEGT